MRTPERGIRQGLAAGARWAAHEGVCALTGCAGLGPKHDAIPQLVAVVQAALHQRLCLNVCAAGLLLLVLYALGMCFQDVLHQTHALCTSLAADAWRLLIRQRLIRGSALINTQHAGTSFFCSKRASQPLMQSPIGLRPTTRSLLTSEMPDKLSEVAEACRRTALGSEHR